MVVQCVKLLPVMRAFHLGIGLRVLAAELQSSSLLMTLEKQHKMIQVTEALPFMWETQMKCLAPASVWLALAHVAIQVVKRGM